MSIQPPIYNGIESMTKFMRRIDDFKIRLNEDRYMVIIHFINEWLRMMDQFKYRSLTEFKNINEQDLLADPEHNLNTLNNFKTKFNEIFGFDIKIKKNSTKQNITVLREALKTIDYKLVKHKSKKYCRYTICTK